MEAATATVNLKEFTYGILCGYMERMFGPDGKPTADVSFKMMGYRKQRIEQLK